MLADLKQTLVMLARRPVLPLLAAAVLGLAVALTTATFSVMSALMLRPPAVSRPESLAYVYAVRDGRRPGTLSVADLEALTAARQTLDGATGTWQISTRLRTAEHNEVVRGEAVQRGYFDVLGLPAYAGRPLEPSDFEPGAVRAVVISFDLWMSRFEGRRDLLGTTVDIGDQPDNSFNIVGVTPKGFTGISTPWTPSTFWIAANVAEQTIMRAPPGVHASFTGIVRLRRHVDIREAARALTTRANGAQSAPRHATLSLVPMSMVRIPANPTAEVVPERVVVLLMAVALAVVLATATNVTGIVLTRSLSAVEEMSLRLALGATKLRLARQFMVDGLLLCLLAWLSGLALAELMLRAFVALEPRPGFVLYPTYDGRTVVVSLAVSVLCGCFIGVSQIRCCLRPRVLTLLGSGRITGGQSARKLRSAILFTQMSLSLSLLIVAGTYLRADVALERADRGYDPSNVVVVQTALRESAPQRPGDNIGRAPRAAAFYRRLTTQLALLPGVRAGLVMLWLPLDIPADGAFARVSPVAESDSAVNVNALGSVVSPGYFDAMGMTLLQGRDFDEGDTPTSATVGILSQSVASRIWPHANPIGRIAAIQGPTPGSQRKVFQVVGIVNDVSAVLQESGTVPYAYLSFGQREVPSDMVVVARGASPSVVLQQVGAAVAAADPSAEALDGQSLNGMIGNLLYPRRIAGVVLVASTCVVLLLTVVGVFGVVSQSLIQRRDEIAIRGALGASRRRILALILGEGLTVFAASAACGTMLGYWAIRVAASRFEGMPQFDPLTLAAALSIVLLLATAASGLPVRRATGPNAIRR
jgi:predicted permease